MMTPHRKRVKHFEQERHVHELTFSCFQRRPLLTNELWRTWFCDAVDAACERHGFLLLAYVVMPDHVHLLVLPVDAGPQIAGLLAGLKRPFARRVKEHLVANRSPLLDRLTIRQRPGVTAFRFWQEGAGYDRNLTEPKAIEAAIDYIHANPVRRELCQHVVDWPWSSARRLLTDGPIEECPRLSRFDPSLLVVDSTTSGHREEHC